MEQSCDTVVIAFEEKMFVIDVEATRKANQSVPVPDCSCLLCENYRQAYMHGSREILGFFARLGVDARNPGGGVNYLGGLDDDPRLRTYCAIFHLAGHMLPVEQAGEYAPMAIDVPVDGQGWLFSPNIDHPTGAFPRPDMQMDAYFSLPWVLEQPPD